MPALRVLAARSSRGTRSGRSEDGRRPPRATSGLSHAKAGLRRIVSWAVPHRLETNGPNGPTPIAGPIRHPESAGDQAGMWVTLIAGRADSARARHLSALVENQKAPCRKWPSPGPASGRPSAVTVATVSSRIPLSRLQIAAASKRRSSVMMLRRCCRRRPGGGDHGKSFGPTQK